MARKRGFVPLALPTIQLVPRGPDLGAEFLAELARVQPDYALFLSSRAAKVLFASDVSLHSDLCKALSTTNVTAVGPKTEASLKELEVSVRYVAKNHSSVGVGELYSQLYSPNARRIIIPRSGAAGDFVRLLLEKIGYEVYEMHLYDVQPDGSGGDWSAFQEAASKSRIDAIVFTSASNVRAFVEIVGKDRIPKNAQLVAIGPFTSMELESAGLVHEVAKVHTTSGALDAIN